MNKKCRLCLGNPAISYAIPGTDISNMIEALTSIKVTPDDIQSTVSCLKCILNVKFAFNIQQNILKADEQIRNQLDNLKMEITDELSDDVETLLVEAETPKNDLAEISICDGQKCMLCGLETDGSLTKHIQEHFNSIHSCTRCDLSFYNVVEYKNHQLLEHNPTVYKCDRCDLKFEYENLYTIHINTAHIKTKIETPEDAIDPVTEVILKRLDEQLSKTNNQSFSCNICNKRFPTRRQLNAHSHVRVPCPICHAQITKSNIRKHIMNHSSGPQVCELCGATLRSLESLRGHLAHTHSTKSYTCEKCGKIFQKRYPYLLHMKKHNGEKSHICEVCGKSFLTLFYLNKHFKTAHLKLRPHLCEYCNKQFSSRHALRTHVRQHTNETPYVCEICGDGFRQNISLRSHRKSKHNIIEPKTCACQICGKQFGSDQAIISHMRLH